MIHATAHNDGPQARLILQRRLLGLLALGFLGTGAELLLLGHTEGFWQRVPLAIIAMSLVALALRAFRSGALSNRTFQIAMWLATAGGGAGIALHFQANREFKLEMQPALSGLPLVWISLKKGLTPALAPGMLILLGLLGLLTTFPPAPPAPAPTNTTTTNNS